MNSETLSKLFQPFSQADASTARRYGGTGLGLSISKSLIESMKGEIGLTSIEGQGSHAWFTVPFKKTKDSSITDSQNTQSKAQNLAFTSPNLLIPSNEKVSIEACQDSITSALNRPREDFWILIAEDNKVNARIALKNVQKLSFNCTVVENGNLAVAELKFRDYDLVLMDCQMPECDGYEATKKIRKSDSISIQTIPVIALTASAIKGDEEKALEAGMVDYLTKMVKRIALENTLCKWLFDQNARQILARFLSSPRDDQQGTPKRWKETSTSAEQFY
jgi:CheY-like chemotaxis protein